MTVSASTSSVLPGSGGVAGDALAVLLALAAFALLYLMVRWLDKV